VLRSTRLPAAATSALPPVEDQQARTGELRDALETLRASLEGRAPRTAAAPAATPAPPADPAPPDGPASSTAPSSTAPSSTAPSSPAPSSTAPSSTAPSPTPVPPSGDDAGPRRPDTRAAWLATLLVLLVLGVAVTVVTGARPHGPTQGRTSTAAPASSASSEPTVGPTPTPAPASPSPGSAGGPATEPLPWPGGPVLRPHGLAASGPGATSPGLELTAALDPDGRHVDVFERLVLRPGTTSLLLREADLGRLASALPNGRGDVSDLQVELDGQAVAAQRLGPSWTATRSDGAAIAHAVLRYRLTGVFVRGAPAPPGRMTLVLRPLGASSVLGTGDPVVVRISDARAGIMTCPTSSRPLCGSVTGRTHTANLPQDATGVVLVQIDGS
jgi:hypothetical protein